MTTNHWRFTGSFKRQWWPSADTPSNIIDLFQPQRDLMDQPIIQDVWGATFVNPAAMFHLSDWISLNIYELRVHRQTQSEYQLLYANYCQPTAYLIDIMANIYLNDMWDYIFQALPISLSGMPFSLPVKTNIIQEFRQRTSAKLEDLTEDIINENPDPIFNDYVQDFVQGFHEDF